MLGASGLAGVLATVISSEDVSRSKPDPEPYALAAARLRVPAARIAAFEDTEAGVASAKAAGMHVVGVTQTLGPERLAQADALVERVGLDAVRALVP